MTNQNNSQSEGIAAFPAMLKGKCARCRTGNMFKPGLTNNMYQKCDHCGLTFERHPGYFYTAMYVTYVFNVAEIVAFGIATYVLSGGSENPWLYLGIIMVGIVILAPLNFRYSRIIQMYWLDPTLKYQPKLSGNPADEQDSPHRES